MYLAEDTFLHREVAIKKIHPHLLERPEAIQRFNNEAKIIASLSHENIVTVYDYGETDRERYLVMEYIDGHTLVEVIEKYGILPNIVLINILIQVLSGLKAAHSKGVYHRDVKPDNVMIDRNGCAHIMDFGIAYLVNQESMTLTGSFVGSPSYIAPEQLAGGPITEKSDVFSFGSLCYVCATDNTPFSGDNPNAIFHKVVNEEPLSPLTYNPEVLHWLNDFIMHCLQKDPQKRPDTQHCIDQLIEKCNTDGIILNKARYAVFCADPEKYHRHERKELYQLYHKKAHGNYSSRKYVAVLKNIDQMRAYDQLDVEDTQLFRKIVNRGKIKRVVLSLLIFVFALAGFFILLENLPAINTESDITSNENRNDSTLQVVLKEGTSSHINDSLNKIEKTDVSLHKKPKRQIVRSKVPRSVSSVSVRKPEIRQQYGYLNLHTNPPWVTVIIDDIKVGKTPKTGIIQLKPGEHRLILEKVGYLKTDHNIAISENDTLNKKVLMRTAGAADKKM